MDFFPNNLFHQLFKISNHHPNWWTFKNENAISQSTKWQKSKINVTSDVNDHNYWVKWGTWKATLKRLYMNQRNRFKVILSKSWHKFFCIPQKRSSFQCGDDECGKQPDEEEIFLFWVRKIQSLIIF